MGDYFFGICRMASRLRNCRSNFHLLEFCRKCVVHFSAIEQALKYAFDFQCHIPRNPIKDGNKGIAYITYRDPQEALEAYKALDGKAFLGRLLHILASSALPSSGTAPEETSEPKSVNTRKQRKVTAPIDEDLSWATLYMNVRSFSPY